MFSVKGKEVILFCHGAVNRVCAPQPSTFVHVDVRDALGPKTIHSPLLMHGDNLSFVLIKTLSSMKTNKLCKLSPLLTSAASSSQM